MMKIKNLVKSTIAILLFISLIGITPADAQNGSSTLSAYRTLPSDCIEPNANFTITVSVSNYGTIGEVDETLCDGWTYINSSLKDSQVSVYGNIVKFYLFGETKFTYTVRAPSDEDKCCTISGILKDQHLNSIDVGGESDNTICTCPEQSSEQDSSSSRSRPSSTFTAQPTEESTVQPTDVPTEAPTGGSSKASPGGSGDNITEEATDEGPTEEQDATPGFTVVTMLIAAIIGIMLRSSTKK